MSDAASRSGPGRSEENRSQANPLAKTDELLTTDAAAPAAGTTLLIDGAARGDRRFTMLGPHAEGGLGRVHRARDEQLHRLVALKEIRPERADDPQARQRFLNEAEITGQLEHPGIVPIYALERDDGGRPVYAMRFIQGRTLSAAIKDYHRRPTVLGLRELLQRFIAVCQTMAYAHSKGVIHRDLKPANVMLGDYGETLVVDWGLAKVTRSQESGARGQGEPEASATGAVPGGAVGNTMDYIPAGAQGGGEQLTVAGEVLGTPAYMAPEQGRGEVLGPAADIYALGAVLYELITGKAPYRGASALEVLEHLLAGTPPAPRQQHGSVPRALNAICLKAMARQAEERYATAAELARDVEHFLADEPVAAYREPLTARLGRWARRNRTLVISLGVAALLLLVSGAGFTWWQERVAEDRRVEQERLAGERRIEQAGNTQQIEALLDRCQAAIQDDDAVGAQLAVGDAEKRAENPGTDHLKDRLARCRLAADLLAELDRIDDLRWAYAMGSSRGDEEARQQWPGALARIGVVVGQTPPEEAAARVNDSLVRDRLLAALDMWLVLAPPNDRAALVRLLAAADADPFRDAVRAGVQRSDGEAVTALAKQEEVLRQPARFAAALGSIASLPRERKIAVLESAANGRPRAFAVLMTAGGLYHGAVDPQMAAERHAWYRSAVTVRPRSGLAHRNLASALKDKGDLDGAIAEYRTVITIDPQHVPYVGLGNALLDKGDLDGAIAAYRTAITHDPKFAGIHINLGIALKKKGDLDGTIAAIRNAIAVEPKDAGFHFSLGDALKEKGDLDGAIAAYRTAITFDPNNYLPHINLGSALRDKCDLDGAATSYQEALRLNPKDTWLPGALAEVERWRPLLPRLDDVASGKAEPASAAEAVDYSWLCYQPFLKRYAAAARLYAKACAANASYATEQGWFYPRSSAAFAAALAGCGQGADAPKEAFARAALRQQALTWMETNRKLLVTRLESGKADDRKYVPFRCSEWLREPDLVGTRPGAKRDGWSREEAAAWDTFWSEVHSLRARACEVSKPATPPAK